MAEPTPLDSGTLRKLLRVIVPTPADLDAFCLDEFPDVAARFASGQNRVDRENLLLQIAEAQQVGQALRKTNPRRYARHYRLLSSAPGAKAANPYRGLSAFDVGEADLFFGRDELTELLWKRFQALYEQAGATRILAVLGPSGSGKSSVARAGLLAELHSLPIPGPAPVRPVVLKPGDHPLMALAIALLPAAQQPPTTAELTAQRELSDFLRKPNASGELNGLRQWAANRPDAQSSPFVILVDQFEEVYTLCTDKQERDAFLGLLLLAAADRGRRVSVVLTLRSDFLGETQRHHPELNRLISAQAVIVGAMSREELRQAIDEPAARAGQPLDDATVELLLSQSWGSDGTLPLLEFALTGLWEEIQAKREPGEVLRKIGGVGGAVAGKAQEIFDKLTAAEKKTAQRALVRLVRLGQGARDTRRRAPIAELCGRGESEETVLELLRKFSTEHARLVTLRTEGGQTLAEVTHEALFEHWKLLREWIDQGRKDRELYDRALEAAKLWKHDGKPAGRLWRPPDLDLLRNYQRRKPDDFGPLAADFLAAAERRQKTDRALFLGGMGAIVVALLFAAGIYVAKERQRSEEASIAKEQIRQKLLENYVERGQPLLFDPYRWSEGTLWLYRAKKEGSRDPILPYLLKSAMQSVDATKAVLVGHRSSVLSASFSADGTRVVTASWDNTARVWDAKSGGLLAELKGHGDSVVSASFSADGTRVVTASSDHTARVWDAKGGGVLAELKGHGDGVLSASFSADGTRVVTASVDNTARVWDAKSGEVLAKLKGHRSSVWSASFSADGTRVVTASWDNTARVWDAKSGGVLAELKGHGDNVASASFSADGARVVTASSDHTARVWDAKSGEVLAELKGHGDRVISASFSADGTRVVTASSDHTARVWDAKSGGVLAELKGHGHSVVSASFSADGTRVVTASWDHTARVWDAKSGGVLAELKGHGDSVVSACFSRDGTRAVTASWDHTARVWDAKSSGVLAELKGHGDSVVSASFSKDGTRVVTASSDHTARVWDAKSGGVLAELKGHGNNVASASFSADGARVVTASSDKTARVWDAKSGGVLAELKGHGDSVVSASFSADGTRVVTASSDNTARVWDAKSGGVLAELKGHRSSVVSAIFSADGTRVLTSSLDNTARVWDAKSGGVLAELKGHGDNVASASFSADGTRVVTASWDKTARVWDAKSGGVLAELKGHGDSVWNASFSADGTRVVTASADHTARVWDAKSGGVLAELKGHGHIVVSASFNAAATRVVTASSDNTARVWDTKSGGVLAELKSHVSRVWSASFSADATRVVTASSDNTARVWDAAPETRDAKELEPLIRCRVPARFVPEGSSLILAHIPTTEDCQSPP